MRDSIFTHAFIKDNKLVLVFGADSSSEYRLKHHHPDKYVCAIGQYTVDRGVIFLSSLKGDYKYMIKG